MAAPAHIVGNSLGGYLSFQLAARGRARTVVALAPAGGWDPGDGSAGKTLRFFEMMQELLKNAAPHAEAIVASPEGRRRARWKVDAENVTCPVRIVWGTADRILTWPQAAVRYRNDWFPSADWVELEGVGHCPQLDVPTETAQLILGFTAV